MITIDQAVRLLTEHIILKKANLHSANSSSFCGCCGTMMNDDRNTVVLDPTNPGAYNYNGRIRGSCWTEPVEFSSDRTEHLVIPDEDLEFLIEWNDK